MSHKINSETGKRLFELATEVENTKPWERLSERDFFGVKDPSTGAVAVVSTSGGAGQVFAIQTYLPEEGIRFWNTVMKEERIPEDIYTNQRMLECEFCEIDDLPDEDVAFFHEYGLKNSCQSSVAVFRAYRPRYFPWFMEQKEADKFILVLELYPLFLAHLVGEESKNYDSFTDPDGFPEIPVFCLSEGGDASNVEDWSIEKEIFPSAAEPFDRVEKDEIFLNRHQTAKQNKASWEIAIHLMTEPSFEEGDERPHFPALCLCLDPDAELEPSLTIESPEVSFPTMMRKVFSEAVDRYGYLPTELRVGSELAVSIFEGIDESYGVSVKKVESLEAIEKIVPTLLSALSEEMNPEFMEMLSDPNFDPDNLSDQDKDMLRSLGMDV